MNEIKEFGMDKYIVVKREDVLKYLDNVSPEDRPDKEEQFYNCLNTITRGRDADNKPKNKYLVLNLDDEINIKEMFARLLDRTNFDVERFEDIGNVKVKDIAVDLVNTILKTKDKQ